MSLEHRPEERAFVAQEAARFLGVAERGLALRIVECPGPEFFVFRERREREERQCDVAGAFGGQEVAVVLSAELVHQRNPEFAEVLELLDLGRIDDVTQMAGDHSWGSLAQVGCPWCVPETVTGA